MRRREFLQEFLGALGAIEIQWLEETEYRISGVAIYEPGDSEETQEFVWHKSEADVPSQEVVNLAKLLREEKLLSIDQISVSRSELLAKYSSKYDRTITVQEFTNILESLESIEVPMVDEGCETDAYFIHE